MNAPMPLRQRNRLMAMREVQRVAVELFERVGYAATTVEQVAEASGLSASSVFRYFGTKERIVLWDERDEVVDTELVGRLGRQPAVIAFRDAVVVALAERDDLSWFRRRLAIIYREQEVWAAAAAEDRGHRRELADALARADGRRTATLQDATLAAMCLAAVDAALEVWHSAPSPGDLRQALITAFEVVMSPAG